MGTKLGNLHIRNATVEEVAPLLPGAIVGQWADGFVSAYSEEYQWGSAEQAGRKLSRKLPHATVLTAAIFDSDVVSFEVYRAGKRLTAHLLNPYEDINRPGNPKVFCEALGLPPEDEKRLRTLWKKGNAEEQLELTGSLLGLPLYHDPAYMPKESVHRNLAAVDAWIAERPDPPKPARIKNMTKAELVRETGGNLLLNTHSKYWGNTKQTGFLFCQDIQEGRWVTNDVWIYCYTPEDPLSCIGKVVCPLTDERTHFCGGPVCYVLTPDRILFGNTLFEEINMIGMPPRAVGMQLCYDSSEQLTLPLDIEGFITRIQSMPNGEISIITIEWKDREYGTTWNVLSRYAKDGTCLYQKELPNGDPEHWLYLEEGFLVVEPQSENIFLNWEGIQLFFPDREVSEIVRREHQKNHADQSLTDGLGRRWLKVESSTLEGYDPAGNLVSRHRLKGEIINTRLDPEGRLLAYTYHYNTSTLRVYRIS